MADRSRSRSPPRGRDGDREPLSPRGGGGGDRDAPASGDRDGKPNIMSPEEEIGRQAHCQREIRAPVRGAAPPRRATGGPRALADVARSSAAGARIRAERERERG